MSTTTKAVGGGTDTEHALGRRGVLRALGMGAGIAAFSGLGRAHGNDGGGGDGPIPAERLALDNPLISGHEVHPVYGFSSQTARVAPPVEPDHEVQALIRPHEDVPIPEFYFEPTGLFVEPGETVKFTMATPHHNVVAYHPQFGFQRRVPQLVPPFSGPMLPAGGYWLYTFEKPGVYEMNCAPHEYFGMVMRIVVGEVSGPAAEPLPDLCAAPAEDAGTEEAHAGPELRLPELTAYTVLSDSALDPEHIVERGRVDWDELAPDSKRLFLQPVGFPPCAE
ncbi:cupredoxin domain-containing protein [Halococcus sediminicola]|uniref:cupredoxin domain-containing protein n=1 Tax=Halococcus sediminicola TaxID=1264579 RepID=UPI0006787F89|nr:plastocyanin/azurin family copper-binding protein [Halococcus sediminicola]